MKRKSVEEFDSLLNRFYDHGLLKQVYSNGISEVCNVFNQYYIVFNKNMISQMGNDFIGFRVNANGLKNVMEDDDFIYGYFQNLTPKQKRELSVVLCEDYFKFLRSNKLKFEKLNPTTNVDLDLERELLSKKIDRK